MQSELNTISTIISKFRTDLDDKLEHNGISPETNNLLEKGASALEGALDFLYLVVNQKEKWKPSDIHDTLEYKMEIHGWVRKVCTNCGKTHDPDEKCADSHIIVENIF